jgi:hypothetical protein
MKNAISAEAAEMHGDRTKNHSTFGIFLLAVLGFLILVHIPAMAATYYLDCAVSSSGNGQSWATAWKSLANITGLNAGDKVYISGSSSCSTYSTSQWTPINGTTSNPITYQVGQDSGHNSPVTITLTGAPGLSGSGGTLQGIVISGLYNSAINMSINGLLGAAGSVAWNGVQLTYLTMNNTIIEGTTFQNFRLDHCSAVVPAGSDHFFTSSASAGLIGYTSNTVDDNLIELYQMNDGSGHGTDGFQWLENVSFYNNTLVTLFNSTQNGQHQDGIQTSGSYLAIYDNYFENFGNYPIYGDLFGNSAHWRIYNNVSVGGTLPLQHFALGFENTGGFTLNDVLVANNTIYSSPSGPLCVSLGGGASGNNVTNSYIVNNICYGSSVQSIPGSGGSITVSNNAQGTSGLTFVNTSLYPNGNWELTSGATAAIGQGINPVPSYITNVFDNDKNNNTRVNPWDLGAYMYLGGGGPPAPPSNLTAMPQ